MPAVMCQSANLGAPVMAQAWWIERAWVIDIASRAVASIAASWPIAPSGVWANPVGTLAGPAFVAVGIMTFGAVRAAGADGFRSSAVTFIIGAAATSSRYARPFTSETVVGKLRA